MLSPQVKGKVERLYQRIQDCLLKEYVRAGVFDISQAQPILNELIGKNNYHLHLVHSTTK